MGVINGGTRSLDYGVYVLQPEAIGSKTCKP